MFSKGLRYFASLWLTVIILAVMILILSLATWCSGYDVSIGALRRDWYGSWWFMPLMGLLMVNLTACTIKRKPWQFWQWGFLVTHSGILTLMIGAAISFQFKIYGDMQIEKGATASDFNIEGEEEIVVHTPNGREHRVPVSKSYSRRPLSIARGLGESLILYVDEYVPNVGREPWYEASPQGTLDVIEVRYQLQRDARSFFMRSSKRRKSCPRRASASLMTWICLRVSTSFSTARAVLSTAMSVVGETIQTRFDCA